MRPLHPQLPKGARVYLPDEAARKRHVEARLLDVVTRWGYREIVTSTFEYADVLAMGTDEGVQENMFKLVDRETGRMLALRADITPQIARIVAARLRDEPKPIRLAYVTNVFRYDEPQVSHYREFYQAGVELIGLEKPEAEVEVIAMAIEGLRALGLERFQIDLGHPDFFRGLCEDAGAEPARVRELRAALARKDASTLERIVSDLAPAPHVREALLALPTLFGHEAVLEPAGARLLHHRLPAGQDRGAVTGAAAARPRRLGRARHHQPRARGVGGLRARAARAPRPGRRESAHRSGSAPGAGSRRRLRARPGGAGGACRAGTLLHGCRRWLTSWSSGRSGATRGRARSSTTSPRTWTSSSATRAATTPATRWSSGGRSTSSSRSPRASSTAAAAASSVAVSSWTPARSSRRWSRSSSAVSPSTATSSSRRTRT